MLRNIIFNDVFNLTVLKEAPVMGSVDDTTMVVIAKPQQEKAKAKRNRIITSN